MERADLFDLGRMPWESLLPLAESRTNLTREDIANGMREHPSMVSRSFDPASDYFFRVHRIPYLCHLIGNDLIIRWQQARYDYLQSHAGTEPACTPLTAANGLRSLAGLMREVGEAAAAIEAAAKDDCLDRQEARRIKREVLDVMDLCMDILRGVEGVLAGTPTQAKATEE